MFVLYSNQEELERRSATFEWWKRLQHYYRLNKAGTEEQFDDALTREVERVELDLQIFGALRAFESAFKGEEPLLTVRQVEKVQLLLDEIAAKLKTLKASLE